MKRSSFKAKKPLKREIAEYRKTPKKGWIAPSWLKSIPHRKSDHGDTVIKKKLWRLTSDYVRIKDYYLYGGVCPGCKKFKFSNWKDGQACHFKRWTRCNTYGKYYTNNILLGCADCNKFGEDGLVGFNFGNELIKRYGYSIIDEIDLVNERNKNEKFNDIILVEMIEETIKAIGKLPEQPEYYDKLLAKKKAV